MKMSILNIIISFFLIFQFSLANLNILYDLSNISRIDQLYSVEEDCGTGCRLIKVWIWTKCWCPTKPKNKYLIINFYNFFIEDNNKMGSPL
jgi:hypothetical protein